MTGRNAVFERAAADDQMYAAISRNPGWRFEMINPCDGGSGHRYRYAKHGRHTGTITVRPSLAVEVVLSGM